MLDHARRVLALTSDLMVGPTRVRGAERGRVRLGMIDVAAVVHFTDVVAAFRRDRPEVHLTLSVAPSAELLAGVRDGELDLAVCVSPVVTAARVCSSTSCAASRSSCSPRRARRSAGRRGGGRG